jgi:hypothetical protein
MRRGSHDERTFFCSVKQSAIDTTGTCSDDVPSMASLEPPLPDECVAAHCQRARHTPERNEWLASMRPAAKRVAIPLVSTAAQSTPLEENDVLVRTSWVQGLTPVGRRRHGHDHTTPLHSDSIHPHDLCNFCSWSFFLTCRALPSTTKAAGRQWCVLAQSLTRSSIALGAYWLWVCRAPTSAWRFCV